MARESTFGPKHGPVETEAGWGAGEEERVFVLAMSEMLLLLLLLFWLQL